jgi:hypothetical protein
MRRGYRGARARDLGHADAIYAHIYWCARALTVPRRRSCERFKLLHECVAIGQAAPALFNVQKGEPSVGIALALVKAASCFSRRV